MKYTYLCSFLYIFVDKINIISHEKDSTYMFSSIHTYGM